MIFDDTELFTSNIYVQRVSLESESKNTAENATSVGWSRKWIF
jgi:hypothetical protein